MKTEKTFLFMIIAILLQCQFIVIAGIFTYTVWDFVTSSDSLNWSNLIFPTFLIIVLIGVIILFIVTISKCSELFKIHMEHEFQMKRMNLENEKFDQSRNRADIISAANKSSIDFFRLIELCKEKTITPPEEKDNEGKTMNKKEEKESINIDTFETLLQQYQNLTI